MASTDLKLDDPGTLPKPGPIGRIARLAFGALCVGYVASLLDLWGSLVTGDGHLRAAIRNGFIPGLLLISYIVNIGFSRACGNGPPIVSATAMG